MKGIKGIYPICAWMDNENKMNSILLTKWLFLKPQNVLESIQNCGSFSICNSSSS